MGGYKTLKPHSACPRGRDAKILAELLPPLYDDAVKTPLLRPICSLLLRTGLDEDLALLDAGKERHKGLDFPKELKVLLLLFVVTTLLLGRLPDLIAVNGLQKKEELQLRLSGAYASCLKDCPL